MNQLATKPKILLIEDDAIVRTVHTTFLEELGCNVEHAYNGKEALAQVDNDYQMIFMDMGLPDLSGIEITKAFKSKKPMLPIIALTGYSNISSKEDFLKIGINEILVKPVFLEQLEKVLQHYGVIE